MELTGAIDVRPLAKKKLMSKEWSLSDVVFEMLHRKLPKEARLSNWDEDELTEQQITYAAKDAYAPLARVASQLSCWR